MRVGASQTAIVDIEQMNRALTALGKLDLSGPITYLDIHVIIEGVRASIIPEPEPCKEEKCPSDTPPKNSSPKSETEQ